jgi:hypothetical protein
MSLIPLDLPAGVYRNGTDMQASGRWRDSNLVRWIDNTMRPVKGWRTRSSTACNAPVRGAFGWKDNSQDIWTAAGTYNKLYVYIGGGIQYDITPTGLTEGIVDADVNTGFGGSFFGTGYYGIERVDATIPTPATSWALDNWGEYLIACSDADGKLYEWQLNTASDAAAITNAPVDNRSVVVTAERFVFALGAGGNPRKVAWCDREDNTTWTPSATNEAGDIELQTSGYIQCGRRVQGQTLILTDVDAHIGTYIGAPYVYGFERVGTSCGIAAKQSVAVTDAGAFWMGNKSFYAYSGGSVQELPCDVSDYVYSNINSSQISKSFAMSNAQFGEIWWFYPQSTEIDSYVVYNYVENTWMIGSLDRTAGFDAGPFKNPTMFGADDYLPYEHEVGFNYGSLTPFAESAPISLGNGDNVMSVTEMIPDERTQGNVQALFKTRFYPNDVEREYGPYDMSNPTSMRFTGRQIRIRIEGAELSDWRLGINRLEAKAGGRR